MPSARIALVTGSNRGLGFETCRQLAEDGCHVLLGARDRNKGQTAARTLRNEGHVVDALNLDLADAESIDSAVTHIIAEYGKLDVLVNNAAILSDLDTQPSQTSDTTLRESFETNFFGPWHLTRALATLLCSAAGRVLNMATRVATLTQLSDLKSPLKDDVCPAYQSSKIALNAMTVLFAKEFAKSGARVNSACPGWVLTDMGNEALPDYGEAAHPQTPQEAVAAFLWLTRDDPDVPTGGFFTGHKRVAW